MVVRCTRKLGQRDFGLRWRCLQAEQRALSVDTARMNAEKRQAAQEVSVADVHRRKLDVGRCTFEVSRDAFDRRRDTFDRRRRPPYV